MELRSREERQAWLREWEKRHKAGLREAAERIKRGEPRPKRDVPAERRKKLKLATTRHYAEQVLSDPQAPMVKRLRTLEGLTIAEAAERAQIGSATWWIMENNPRRISRLTWERAARSLGVEVEQIKP